MPEDMSDFDAEYKIILFGNSTIGKIILFFKKIFKRFFKCK